MAKLKAVRDPKQIERDWENNPRWDGITRDYTADDVLRLRGSIDIEHTLAEMGAERLWELLQRRAVRHRPRRAHRQPGHPAGARRTQGDLSQRLAGCGGRESGRADVSRSESLSVELRAAGGEADQSGAAARRSDRSQRREERHVLVRADRRRCRGGVRRMSERVRADEADDRVRRRGRPLRRPARLREKVRPPRRESSAADVAVHPHAVRGATRGGRDGRADARHRAHGREQRHAADQRHRRARSSVPHRRADGRKASS